MVEAGDIYLGKYAGWYSVRDEAFYAADETEERDGPALCRKTGTPVEWVEEESYFFRLAVLSGKSCSITMPPIRISSDRRNGATRS